MSRYLDDLIVKPGDIVVCKTAISCPNFTPGRVYVCLGDHKIQDDLGQVVRPSARFTIQSKDESHV